ncbi:hypothetical protein [Blastococcus brunescens]|uniref:Uncharacterized protein n=1 Tax=Blastococcus brunescens TaxID=1564165 RepID=A0ABZ1AXU0_9ACTN|nr:hypothetical protein [Blastococcus sp. BMG 8361]WRL61939.1 hypothetical protein U6N30_17765 [Blastococcus sp. BMG 8361]
MPDLGPEGTDFVARQTVPCRVAGDGVLEPLLDPEEHHRGDGTPATVVVDGAVLVGVERRGSVELLRVPLDGGAPEVLIGGPFAVHAVAAAGEWSSPSSRTTGRRASCSRSPRDGAGCSPRSGDRSGRPAGCTGWRSGRPRPRTAIPCTAGSRRRRVRARTPCC